jgi:hypothetical protein
MRKDDRSARNLECRPHRRLRHVAEVDEHADAVHLAHDRLAERRKTVVHGRVGRRIGPCGVRRVRQRHVARAEIVILAQHRERIVDLVAAFDADQRGDPAFTLGAADIGNRIRHREVARPARGDRLDEIDLFDRRLHGGRSRRRDRDPHRPELRADMPGAQARYVGHHRGLAGRRRELGGVGSEIDLREVTAEALADRPRQIVVPVDDRRSCQHGVDACGDAIRGVFRGRGGDCEDRQTGQQEDRPAHRVLHCNERR